MKTVLITGVLGQDGSYLAELLLSKGYNVHGVTRGMIGSINSNYIAGVKYHVADMRDAVALENVFRKVWPDEVYNLAAQVFVPTSWSIPSETFDINVGGLGNLLKIINDYKPNTKLYQASSSEMFGNQSGVLDENAPFKPVSPYGVSKVAAHELAHVYRQKGLFVVCGILFNHESPRRGSHMVTRKITEHIAKWVIGDTSELRLGNGQASRDWGHANDYVEAMHLMMQYKTPDDFVIATGESHTVAEFVQEALLAAPFGTTKGEIVFNAPEFTRSNELFHLRGCPNKAKVMLGWTAKTSFKSLVREMVEHDVESMKSLTNQFGLVDIL